MRIRDSMPERLERIAAGICAAHRAEYSFGYKRGTPVTVNDPRVTELVSEVGRDVLGPDNVHVLDHPSMGAEDFAEYLAHVPGMMFRLGVGTDTTALHTPTYNFGDAPLPYGITMLSNVALRYGVEA